MSLYYEEGEIKKDFIELPPQINCPSYIWFLVDQEKITEEEAKRILNN
ncbi:MAG: hypothetical protein KBC17_00090 [Candidatus Pacebacteria bacterium]|nr:hypothetical protein [Candidatus Paceibacterota bacterium]